jgi:hypothetical protein
MKDFFLSWYEEHEVLKKRTQNVLFRALRGEKVFSEMGGKMEA